MKVGQRRLGALVATLAATGAMTLGLAACGGSDGDSDASADSHAADERVIREVYGQLVEAFYEPDPALGCSVMTESAQKRFAAREPAERTCVKRFATTANPKLLSKNKPRVLKVEINGSRAVATVKTKNSNRYPVPFVKQNDGWKISGGF